MKWVVYNRLLTAVIGLSASLVISCGGAPRHGDGMVNDRRQEIDTLWAEIQDMERSSGLGDIRPIVESGSTSDADLAPISTTSTATSPERSPGQPTPTQDRCHQKDQQREGTCVDVCELASAICVNAQNICRIARELADEDWAHQKCNSATMSCVRADNRCCQCSS